MISKNEQTVRWPPSGQAPRNALSTDNRDIPQPAVF